MLDTGDVSVDPPDEVVFEVPLEVLVVLEEPVEVSGDVVEEMVGLDGSTELTVLTV